MTQRRFGRRDALRMAGLGAFGAALSACGVKGQGKPQASAPPPDAVAKYWSDKTKNGHVDFANWPLYMDPKHPELKKFTQETGTTVTYKEVIQDMGPWFAKVQPQLSARQSIGYDLMVITNGIQFGQFVNSGFLAPLDHSKLPNFAANAGAAYKKESFDKGNVYSIPWASGMSGIAYDPSKIHRPITKLADLWDSAFKGKVGMFQDTQELGNFGMMVLGITPEKSTSDDWRKAADKLKKQKSDGIVRNYYDQSYIDALAKGEVWITQAWSGDVYQKNVSDGTNFKFVIPDEGATIWTDNMAIPITAKNPLDAITLMDFFYKPDIAGSLAEYINYVCPVPSARAAIQKDADKATGEDKKTLQGLVSNQLIFPSDATYARLHYYRDLSDSGEQQQYQQIFEPIVLG